MTRFLGIADETVFGTPVSPPTTFLDVRTIGLHAEREEIRASGMTPLGPLVAVPGQYKILGDIALFASADNLMKFLKYLVGAPTTVQDGSSGRYRHTFDPSATLKWGTFYKIPEFCGGTTTDALQYISTIPVSGRFECSTGNPLLATFGMLGLKDAKVTAPTLGTLSTVRPFVSLDAKIYWDIAETLEIANVDSLSFTYNRPIADDAYAMNDPFLKCFIGGEITLEGEMDLLFNDWEAYENFWGSASGPVVAPEPVALVAKWLGDPLGGTGEFEKYSFVTQVPRIMLKSIDDPIELREKIMQTVAFSASRGTIDSDTVIARFKLYNKIATA